MGNRDSDYDDQHCRLLHLDPIAHVSSCEPNVSHTAGFVKQTDKSSFVRINNVWDRISKVLILIVDAGLNWYFLRTVKKRLLEQNGLTKYKPLVAFNAKLMVVSIAMDVSV
jgi:hypothetical protein